MGLPHAISFPARLLMGKVELPGVIGIRTQVPSPGVMPLIKRVVKMECPATGGRAAKKIEKAYGRIVD